MIEHEGRCGDGQDDGCPICQGNVASDFIERMKAAGAQPGEIMTIDEFMMWLDGQAASIR